MKRSEIDFPHPGFLDDVTFQFVSMYKGHVEYTASKEGYVITANILYQNYADAWSSDVRATIRPGDDGEREDDGQWIDVIQFTRDGEVVHEQRETRWE